MRIYADPDPKNGFHQIFFSRKFVLFNNYPVKTNNKSSYFLPFKLKYFYKLSKAELKQGDTYCTG
jgi:hypothetical protein